METSVAVPQASPTIAVDADAALSQTEIMDHDYFSQSPAAQKDAEVAVQPDKDIVNETEDSALGKSEEADNAGESEVRNEADAESSENQRTEACSETCGEVRNEVSKDEEDMILTLSPARNEQDGEGEEQVEKLDEEVLLEREEAMEMEGGAGEKKEKEESEALEEELLAEDPNNPSNDQSEDEPDERLLEAQEVEVTKNNVATGNIDDVQEVTEDGHVDEADDDKHAGDEVDSVKEDKKSVNDGKVAKSTSAVEIQTEIDSDWEEVESGVAGGSKSESLKDDNDNDKDTVSTATAEEVGEGSEEMNNAEEEEEEDEETYGENEGSFLSAENLNRIAEHAESETESESEMNDGTPKTSKRGRKTKDFGASFVTEDEDMGLIIDPEWKESRGRSSTRGRYPGDYKTDLTLLRVPFEYGWKRELVVRNQKEGQNKTMDTYYHPPEGSKLRSMVQIADYLAKHDSPLSTDNFTFSRKCIHEPPHEIVRQANSGRVYFQKKMRGRGRGRGRSRGRGWSPGSSRVHRMNLSTPSPEGKSTVSPPLNSTPVSGAAPGKRRPGRPPKLSFPPPEVVIERDEEEADTSMNLSPPVNFGQPVSIKRSHSDDDDEEDDDCARSPTSKPPRKKATARKSTTPRIASFKTISKVVPPPTIPPPSQPLGQLCTLQCPGLEGSPPSLQCAGCMCLFHPKCVNYKGTNMTNFLCLICAQDPSKQMTTTSVMSVVSRPPTLISSPSVSAPVPTNLLSVSRSMLTPSTTTILVRQALPPVPTSVTGSSVTTVNQNSTTIGALRSILDKRQIPNLPNFSSLNIVTSIAPATQAPAISSILANTGVRTVNASPSSIHSTIPILPVSTTSVRLPPLLAPQPSVPTSLIRAAPPLTLLRPPPPPLTKPAQVAIPQIPPPRLTVAPGVLVPVSQGSGMIQPRTDAQITTANTKQPDIPLNAQLLTLPEAVTKRLKLSQPLALKINNIQIVVPPSCVINSSDGLKVLLPPNTFPLPTDPNAKLSVTVSNNTAGLEGGDPKDVSTATTVPSSSEGEPRSSAKKDTPVISSPSTRASKRRQAIDAALCYIKKLYGGYDCMLQIFEYLRTQDLLRASTVCRTWKKIATQPCLWKRVRLRSTVVSDWEAAAQFFRKVRVESLCLQGMYHKHDRNRTWHLMIANLHQLVGLREIEFGHVPASVLHQVCEKLVNLEVFKAEYIAEVNGDQNRNIPCKVDLGKFVCLKHLRELRLRGTGGLTLPAFSFNGGLAELAALKNLETLSLTTLKSIPDNEFHFLRDMKQLKFLEVGNCNTWSSETYFVLGSLINLVHLRLEYGGEIPDIGLGDALNNLVFLEELQLIHFSLADTLYITLENLKKLRSLVVWPEAADMAAVNTNTLTMVSKLQKLQMLEWGVIVTSDSCAPESDNDRQAMWIPFFPPNYMELMKQPNTAVPINRLSLIQLTESLADCLPNTDIKVKKIKSQVKVNGWTNDS